MMYLIRIYNRHTGMTQVTARASSIEEAAEIASKKGLLDDESNFWRHGDVCEKSGKVFPRQDIERHQTR